MENTQFHTQPAPPPPPPAAAQSTTQEIYNYAAALLITQKKGVDEVRNALIQKGLDAQSASVVITNLQAEITKQRKIKAKRDIKYGAGICIVGIVITAITYSMASSGSGGGTYFVAWGAVIFGALQFFRGLINSAR